ncbi:MAG: YggU family protein [Euryarchaeota archaeon]|jgi:uncharacterized protein|nr:YggU family protein [Euryarchaeota archaeon]MBT7938372.1 YggU family protein [Euryarchaeota archaeon]
MGDSSAAISHSESGVLIAIEVQPGARHEGLIGFNEWRQRLQIAVRAPPQDGKANSSILDLFSELLELPVSRMKISSGHTSRKKIIMISESSLEEIVERINELLHEVS